MPKITVLIDSPPTSPYHLATLEALRHAVDMRADAASFVIEVVPTDAIPDVDQVGAIGDGVVVGPGTPYKNPGAAEAVVTSARARGVPLVAT
jgi:hypothetical protein